MPRAPEILSAIDLGTNSFRMVVASVDPVTGHFRPLLRDRETVRLGEGPGDLRRLSSEAMARGLRALRRFAGEARRLGAKPRAVATSAVREAENGGAFVRRAFRETGLRIEVISGAEEARLIYLGVLQALPVFGKRVLLVDIGGGSTELLLAKGRRVEYAHCLKLGSIRFTRRFLDPDRLRPRDLKACRETAEGLLGPVARELKGRRRPDVVVGTAGTVCSLARIVKTLRGDAPESPLNGTVVTRAELDRVVDRLVRARTLKKRREVPGLNPERADIAVAGAIILRSVLSVLGLKAMTVSEYALREGLLLDSMERMRRRRFGRVEDVRRRSVEALGAHCRWDERHARRVAGFSLSLFDLLEPLHGLGPWEREMLEFAALLHDIGVFVSRDQHHRHAYYLIRHAGLLGFTDEEQEVLANVARYHRKSVPKPGHDGFERLGREGRSRVRVLAGILRVADALDRAHRSRERRIRFSLRGHRLRCLLPRNMVEERWSVREKKGLLEKTLGVRFCLSP